MKYLREKIISMEEVDGEVNGANEWSRYRPFEEPIDTVVRRKRTR